MDLLEELMISAISFSKHTVGVITQPYKTYRNVIERGRWGELFIVFIICSIYFGLASLVKTATFHPILLTKQFIVLVAGAMIGFLLVVGLLGLTGKVLNSKYTLRSLTIAWGYTLIPTVLWFLMTSFLYVIIPPPRTESLLGVSFSILYLIASTVLFFWKAELYYLTLRFGLKLDLVRILVVTAIYLPILGIYSGSMYRLGILRIPFL